MVGLGTVIRLCTCKYSLKMQLSFHLFQIQCISHFVHVMIDLGLKTESHAKLKKIVSFLLQY